MEAPPEPIETSDGVPNITSSSIHGEESKWKCCNVYKCIEIVCLSVIMLSLVGIIMIPTLKKLLFTPQQVSYK